MTVPGPALAPVVLALLPTLGAGAPDGPPPDHVTPLLGPGGLQSAPYLRGIEDLATDSDGNLFVAARESSQVLRIAPDGQRTMLIDGSHDLLGWAFS